MSLSLGRMVWRHGFMPQLTTTALSKLQQALEEGSDELVRGRTCNVDEHGRIRACCPVAYCVWRGEG